MTCVIGTHTTQNYWQESEPILYKWKSLYTGEIGNTTKYADCVGERKKT